MALRILADGPENENFPEPYRPRELCAWAADEIERLHQLRDLALTVCDRLDDCRVHNRVDSLTAKVALNRAADNLRKAAKAAGGEE